MPGCLRDKFAWATDCDLDDLPAAWFREDSEAAANKAIWLRELKGMQAIHRAAIESVKFRCSELAWNVKVHQLVLDLALGEGLWHRDKAIITHNVEEHHVGAEYMATAMLTGDCIPQLRA